MKRSFAKRFLGTSAALALGWLGAVETAGAAVYTLYADFNNAQAPTVKINGGGSVYAADYDFFINAGGTYPKANEDELYRASDTVSASFIAWCIDPYQGISPDRTLYRVLDPLAPTDFPQTPHTVGGGAELQSADVPDILRLFDYQPLYDVGATKKTSQLALLPVQSAALQVAIWEIVGEADRTYSLSNGSIKFNDFSDVAAKNLAETLLAYVMENRDLRNVLTPVWLQRCDVDTASPPGCNDAGSQQDFITFRIPPRQEEIVPAPGTLFLIGAGLLSAGLRRRSNHKA